jgi:hypothetical protein
MAAASYMNKSTTSDPPIQVFVVVALVSRKDMFAGLGRALQVKRACEN